MNDATQAGAVAPEEKPAKPPAFILMGVPDDMRARLTYSRWDRPPDLIMQGTASFLGQLKDLPWRQLRIFFGGEKLAMEARIPRAPSINFMADADLYGRALAHAAAFTAKAGTPCFNHPLAVRRTTREEVSQRLQGIPGLEVPRTVRVNVSRIAQLRAAAEGAGLAYPVLVRMAGDHGGVSTVRVDDAGDWEAANPLPWGGRDVYLTQFVDFRDADGFHRKVRLAVVGQEVLLKHRYVSRDWMVHYKSHTQETIAEERAFMAGFDADLLPTLKPVALEVARRLGLDYFGMDVALRPGGGMLLFEANATMNILSTHSNATDLWEEPSRRIMAALRSLLARPQDWRGPPA